MYRVIPFLLLLLMISCAEQVEISSTAAENWSRRKASQIPSDSMTSGSTYLSVYSQIFSQTQHRKYDLTATVSMRNINPSDTIYISKAAYYDSEGHRIRSYFDHPIYLAPLETVDIVIDEVDQAGGTGGNFLFDWLTAPDASEPLFEGVMISTSGQQGLSFTTQGVRVN